MQIRVEVTGAVLRFYAPDADTRGPFLFAAYISADEGVATLKGLAAESADLDRVLLSLRDAVRDALRPLGITRAQWWRRRGGRRRLVGFGVG